MNLPPWLGLLLTPALGFVAARLNARPAERQSAAEKFLAAVQEELGQVRTLLASTAARLDEKDHQVDELRRAVVACHDERVGQALQLRLAQERIGVLVAANEAMVLRLLELEGRVDNKAEKQGAGGMIAPSILAATAPGGAP